MQSSTRFLLLSLFVAAFGSHSVLAQVPTTESDAELRIKQLEKQADSLKKAARHLKDSLHAKIRRKDFGNLFLDTDSLLSNFKSFTIDSYGDLFLDNDSLHLKLRAPDSLSIKGWTQELPKIFHYEIPDLPGNRFFDRIPKDKLHIVPDPGKGKKKTPIDGFKGWYIEELAELGE